MWNSSSILRISQKIKTGILSVVILFSYSIIAFPTPAVAGIGKGNGEIGFDFGFTDFDSNTTDETGAFGAIRGGYHFSNLFELEGYFGGSVANVPFGDLTLSTAFINGVFNFHPRENVVPYLLAGIGTATLEIDLGYFFPTIDDTSAAYQAAFGSRFFFGKNKRAAFRVEIAGIRESTFDESSTHINLVGGFTWRLGAAP